MVNKHAKNEWNNHHFVLDSRNGTNECNYNGNTELPNALLIIRMSDLDVSKALCRAIAVGNVFHSAKFIDGDSNTFVRQCVHMDVKSSLRGLSYVGPDKFFFMLEYPFIRDALLRIETKLGDEVVDDIGS